MASSCSHLQPCRSAASRHKSSLFSRTQRSKHDISRHTRPLMEMPCRVRVDAVEGHPCGQFSYPTLQYVPEDGRIFVAYTVLFLPSAMSPDCKVSSAQSIASCSAVHHRLDFAL